MMIIYLIENEEVMKIPYHAIRKMIPERCRKAERYRRTEDRLMCMGTGILIHCVMKIKEEEIFCTEYGKPYTLYRNQFNVSNSGGCSILTYRNGAVGVDIEQIREENLALSSYVFSETERQWIKDNPLVRFHLLWSIKESIMKATGLGMHLEPLSFEINPDIPQVSVCGQKWYFQYTEWQGKSVAAASEEPIDSIVIKKMTVNNLFANEILK